MVGEGEQKFLTELMKELLSVAKTHVEIQTLWEKPVLHLVGCETRVNREERCSCIPSLAHGKLDRCSS